MEALVSKKENRFRRILGPDSPLPKDVTVEELITCLTADERASVRPGKGDHLIFIFRQENGGHIAFPIPTSRKYVLSVYIKKIRQIVEDLDTEDGLSEPEKGDK
jgi:hypothetical protein